MSEPTLTDVLTAVQTLREDMDRRFDAVDRRFDETDVRMQTLDRKIDTVHGLTRQVQRDITTTQGTVQMLLDAHAMFRQEYLREHPGGGHA